MPKLKLGPDAQCTIYLLHDAQAKAWAYGTAVRLEAWNGEAAVHVNH